MGILTASFAFSESESKSIGSFGHRSSPRQSGSRRWKRIHVLDLLRTATTNTIRNRSGTYCSSNRNPSRNRTGEISHAPCLIRDSRRGSIYTAIRVSTGRLAFFAVGLGDCKSADVLVRKEGAKCKNTFYSAHGPLGFWRLTENSMHAY